MAGQIAQFTLTNLASDTTSAQFEIPEDVEYCVYSNIAAATASDTLDTTIEESPDGGTTWFTAGTFTQVTDAAAVKQKVTVPAGHARLVRLNYNVGGASIEIDGTYTVFTA